MPNRDGRGPNGAGPRTGRGLGKCLPSRRTVSPRLTRRRRTRPSLVQAQVPRGGARRTRGLVSLQIPRNPRKTGGLVSLVRGRRRR